MHPDRVVIGDDGNWAGDAVADLYAPLDAPLVRTDVASAEMVKLAANAFLATKISFINEIANVCEETGADVLEVARGMGLDQRIGKHFLRPGIGFGGSCFPKDVSALKQLAGNSGYHFQLLTAVIEVNELQKRRVIGKLQKHLGSLVGKRITLLGLAFKAETDDMREASSLVLAARLQADGAQVRAYDPIAEREARKLMTGVEFAPSALEALEGADACVLVTEWPEFAELEWREVAEPDGRHAGDRRPQLPRPRCRRGGRADIRGDRALSGRRRAGADPGRRRGDPAAAADLDDPEAGRAAGRPAVHLLHARVAARPRRRGGDPLVRLHGRRRAQRARRRLGARDCASGTSRSPSRWAPAARSSSPRSCSRSGF